MQQIKNFTHYQLHYTRRNLVGDIEVPTLFLYNIFLSYFTDKSIFLQDINTRKVEAQQ